MMHLLKLEFKKFKNYRPFIIMAVLYMVLLPLTLLITKNFPEESRVQEMFGIQGFYTFPNIWKFLAYSGNWIVFFFLGFMGVLSITNEFSNKTLRQNIITGMSRREYFLGKITFVGAVSLAATLVYFLTGFFIGFYHSYSFELNDLAGNANYYFRYFLMCFGYMSFGLFLGTLFRRTGIAIFVFLAYGVFVEVILRGLHVYFFGKTRTSLFYPLNAMEDLAPIPFKDLMEELINDWGFELFLSGNEAVITSSIFISLFLFGVYRILTKKDL